MDALQCKTKPVSLDDAEEITKRFSAKEPKAPCRSTHSKRSNRRATLALSLFVLLLGGILQLATSTPDTRSGPSEGSRADVVFSNALSGTCLAWPPDAPDKPSFVQCSDNHLFEVARPVGMQNFMEPCQLAVRDYLGSHFDPNSKFTSTVLWAGDAQGAKTDEGTCSAVCSCPARTVDRSRSRGRWPNRISRRSGRQGRAWASTPQTGRSTEAPVPCSAPHAVEVAGTANLRDQFPGARPSEPDQDGFLRDTCTRATDEYLAPAPLTSTGLSVNYAIMSSASWNAGSRLVACELGTRRGDDGWVPLTGGVKDGVVGEAPPQAPPPPPPPPPEEEVQTPVEQPPPPVEATTTAAPSATPVTTTAAPTTTTATTTPASPTRHVAEHHHGAVGPAPGPRPWAGTRARRRQWLQRPPSLSPTS